MDERAAGRRMEGKEDGREKMEGGRGNVDASEGEYPLTWEEIE